MYQTFVRLLICVGRTEHQGLLTNRYSGLKLGRDSVVKLLVSERGLQREHIDSARTLYIGRLLLGVYNNRRVKFVQV